MTPTGQTADGTWEIGVRRTFPISVEEAWARLPLLLEGDGAVGDIRSLTPKVVMRLQFYPSGWNRSSTLQLRVIPAATGTTVAVHHEGLPDQASRREMHQHWSDALDRLSG